MKNVPVRAPNTVTWSWFIDDSTGHMIVSAEPGHMPLITVHLRAEGQEQVFDFAMSVPEAVRLAEQVGEMARVARRAEWTPDVVQHVNDAYLHGWPDEDVVAELEKLADYIDAYRLVTEDGTLEPRADAVLRARWP